MQDRALTDFLQSTAGQYLRGVVKYDTHDYDLHYIRDDLKNEQFLARVANIYDQLIQVQAGDNGEDTFGKPYATLNVREHAVILNLRWSATEGILVGLYPEAARQLEGFVNESMKRGLPDDVAYP